MAANAFESGARKLIPAVLIYASVGDRPGDRVLMIHRNADGSRPGDTHSGKWNGLGGKSELNESPLETARREFHEEAGVELPWDAFRALGVLTFPNFKSQKAEDWIVHVFAARLPESLLRKVSARNDEGELHWIPSSDLLTLNLWPGDRHFIPFVTSGRPFLGTIWYEGGNVSRHWIQAL